MFKIRFFPDEFIWVVHPPEGKVTLDDVIAGDAVFVTGKLMDPEFVHDVVGRFLPFSPALAKGFERAERREGEKIMLLLQPNPADAVVGVLLLQLAQSDLQRLDAFEQVPSLRQRTLIRVSAGTCERTAYTFLPK